MNKQKGHIFVALILVLLMAAGITAWLTAPKPSDEAAEPSASPTAAPDVSPSDEPSPSVSPSAEPTPTPTPAPSQDRLMSGSFDSDTGTSLNTHTEWAVTRSQSGALVMEVRIYVRSYTLGIGPRSGVVTINGTAYSFRSEALSIESNDSPTETLIYSASQELYLNPGELLTVPISVTWNYNGVYSGNDIKSITSETSVTVTG
ncbi:MAG: hypothetical protein SOT16_04165 [Oscillospiraceae bacterium]|nr:hypothetical protein [Oscillospiraceae bacterium]